MNPSIDVSVVFPAFNEEGRLEPTLREAAHYFKASDRSAEFIVVDDGSRDRTSALVRRLAQELDGLRLIRLADNRGKGYAVRTGVLNAYGRSVLFADSDGAAPMGEFSRLEAVLDSGVDVAIGSRVLQSNAVRVSAKGYRRVIGRAFRALVRISTATDIQDTQCGFKLFKARAAQDLFSRMRIDGFAFDVEVLLMARRCGYSVAEVPINWTHQPGSRVNLVLDSMRMMRDLMVIRSHALRGHYDQPHVARWAEAEEQVAPPPVIAG